MKIKITKQRYNQIIQEELELLPRDPHQRAIEKLHRRIRAGLSDAASNVAPRLYGAIPKSIKQKEDIDTPPLGHEGPSPATITKTARDYAQDAAKHDAMDSIKNIAIRLKNNFDITDVTAAGAAFKIFKYLRESHDRSSKSKLNQIIQEEVEALMREEQDLRAQAKQDITVTQYSKQGSSLRQYKFIGAFPTTLSAIALDWGTSEVEEFTCSWTYDRWEAEDKSTAKRKTIGE